MRWSIIKILIGVCGIGLGHSTRQYEVAKELQKRGHEVRIITFLNGCNFFKNTGFKFYDVWVPIVKYKEGRLNLYSLIIDNYKNVIEGLLKNQKVITSLQNEDFIPDVCISDYEPVTARIAYKFKKKLIIIDQQSKFWKYNFENISNYSPLEEKKRLNLFFPKYDKSFITSFYKLPDLDSNKVEVIAPIIKEEIRNNKFSNNVSKSNTILVYFSEYVGVGIKQSLDELIKLFSNFQNYNFVIFDKNYSEKIVINPNVIIYPFDKKGFTDYLKRSQAVITTAGHTLISEALYLNSPLYLIPLGTFDQHFCARFIKEQKLGYSSLNITIAELDGFLKKLNLYKKNILQSASLLIKDDSLEKIVRYIESHGHDYYNEEEFHKSQMN